MKRFDVRTFRNDGELAETAATEWLQLLLPDNPHRVALSGGRIAKAFYQAIVELALKQPGPLANVNFFWADERCLPPSDPESNFFLANQYLFEPLHINASRIHRLKGELAPNVAVAEAVADIRRSAPNNESNQPVLDLIILGMGEDGHVASLFPNASEAILGTTAPYLHVANSPKPPPNRLSLNYATIAAAKRVWVLANGSGKLNALKESVSPTGATPLARVLKSRNSTQVFTDLNIASS